MVRLLGRGFRNQVKQGISPYVLLSVPPSKQPAQFANFEIESEH